MRFTLQLGDRSACRVTHFECTLDSLGIVGMNAGRGVRVELRDSACNAGQPTLAARSSMDLRNSGDAVGSGAMPPERAQIQHGAADQQRNAPARLDFVDGGTASSTNWPAE